MSIRHFTPKIIYRPNYLFPKSKYGKLSTVGCQIKYYNYKGTTKFLLTKTCLYVFGSGEIGPSSSGTSPKSTYALKSIVPINKIIDRLKSYDKTANDRQCI